MVHPFRWLTFPFSEYYNLETKKINRAKQEKDGKKAATCEDLKLS